MRTQPPRLVVLAAGASTRMGHPKALTLIGEEPALARIARVAREASLPRPMVVLGEHHDVVRAALPALDVAWVRNAAPEAGRTGSLQVALGALGPLGALGALVLPVDHPLVRADTLRALAARPEPWVVPTCGGRGGHPILLRSAGVAAVLRAPPDAPLRDVPRAAGIEVTRILVEDDGILANLDAPEDLARFTREGRPAPT